MPTSAPRFTICSSPKWETTKSPIVITCISILQYIHIMEYYSTVKMNALQLYASIWLNLSSVYVRLVITLLLDLPNSFIDCMVFHSIPKQYQL